MGPPSSAKMLGVVPQRDLLIKCHEVLQKTRAEQFGLGQVPLTLKLGVDSVEKKGSPLAETCTSALLRRPLIGGQLVGHRAVRGYLEVSNLAVEEVIGIAHIHRNGDGLLFKESSNFHRLRVGVAG
ncbi:hypothetical protein BHE74_00028165 [Ensete ventricosum]|nr:hypothetical protein BHE74_00028165 [Ensete ventricosum]